MLGSIGFVVLIFLPGAWITFSPAFKYIRFWIRLLLGVILAPIVVLVQFYILRLWGISFELASILSVALNLPAVYLIYQQRSKWTLVDRRMLAATGIVLVVIFACAAPFLLNPQKRLYTWEAWSQADIVYSIANGKLDLEDPELAGVRLSYPWGGHVYQAILSYMAGTPPVTNYIWGNILWLLCMFGITAGIVAELGGNSLSQVTAAIWLSFGVNFVGATMGPLIPHAWAKAHNALNNIWGDTRYTPWVEKVLFFGQMHFALGFFLAILYLLIKSWPENYKSYYIAVIGLLLCGIGIIYPVLLPPACAVIGGRVIAMVLSSWTERSPLSSKEIFGLAVTVVVAGVVTYANTKFLTADRTSSSLIHLHTIQFIRWRAAESIVVTVPLLAGLVLVFAKLWKGNRNALIILGSGALASFVLYIFFDIPWWRNEYKFIFTAAICLAPFPSLAMQRLSTNKWALPTLTICTLTLAAPFAYKVYKQGDALYTKRGPLVDIHHFDLRLPSQNPFAELIDVIRERTPINSLLILENADLYFPTLTQRQLYVAPIETEPHPGILITSDEMLTLVKGYSKAMLEQRRSMVRGLFNPENDGIQRAQSLNQILEFNRPLVLVLDKRRHASLMDWLIKQRKGRLLYKENGFVLWLIAPREVNR
jgi:hypothetical protein